MTDQNASMDEILSSIREIVKEEVGGAATQLSDAEDEAASADDIEAMLAGATAAPKVEEPAAKAPETDLSMDEIEAMMAAAASSPETTEEVMEKTPADTQTSPTEENMAPNMEADDILELTSAMEDAPTTPEANALTEDLATDLQAMAGETAEPSTEKEETPAEEAAAAMPTEEDIPQAAAPQPKTTTPQANVHKTAAPATAAESVFLNALPSAKGLQVAFPVEVLAEALRPLVGHWVDANLPDIVERLVREEISKLVDRP